MPARSLARTSAPLGGAAVVCSLVTLTLCMLGGAQGVPMRSTDTIPAAETLEVLKRAEAALDAIAPSDHQARLTEHEKNKALQAELAALQEDSALKLENAELQEKITKLKAEATKPEDVAALTHAERVELIRASRATRAVDPFRRGVPISHGTLDLGGGSNRSGND